MYASLASQVPVVATFHAYAEPVRLYAPWGRSYLVRRMLEKIAVRIAVSEAAASFAQRGLGGSYRIVPNGVQVSLFEGVDPAPDLPLGRRLLFVNRLERRKGFQMAVRAFLQLATEFSDLHLVVAGDGPERTALSELPRALHDRVIMLGNVPHGLLPPYHAGADVFLAPALGRESFGIVLVEAMAARVPVVASDIAGYREVVRSDLEGILVPPGDPSALADAVRRVLLDPALAARLAEAGRARAERYRWDVVIEQIEAVYQEALEKRAVR
jgi:phosphatidylinositol alpha-mannosyltransferase